MIDAPNRDRRAERREATRAEILEAAWAVARANGLAGLSLRDVAASIGMRPPSLYWYFNSKNAIYDAMFAQANRQLLGRLAEQAWPTDPKAILRLCARAFIEFSAEDAERYHLLFQRTLPDFEPSPESYALAVQVFEHMQARLAAAGLSDPVHFDMWTALVAGLSAQQVTNDPGGERWLGLIDEMVDMYANHVLGKRNSRRRQSRRTGTDTGVARSRTSSSSRPDTRYS